jgi:Protein of unknown function (DUF2505)
MPRSFDVLVDSPVSVEQVHSAFGDEDYWLARIAAFGGSKTLDSLVVDSDGTVTVTITEDLRRNALPGILANLYRGDLNVRSTETWRPVADRQVSGEISVAVTGAPGSGHGAAVLAPVPNGSRLTFTATVEFKVPLVGGTIESYVAREFARGIPEIQRFTTEWIFEHA